MADLWQVEDRWLHHNNTPVQLIYISLMTVWPNPISPNIRFGSNSFTSVCMWLYATSGFFLSWRCQQLVLSLKTDHFKCYEAAFGNSEKCLQEYQAYWVEYAKPWSAYLQDTSKSLNSIDMPFFLWPKV